MILPKEGIFVFGSNTAGRHGAGAAYVALIKFGAIPGQGVGLQGRSYGIPTKDHKLRTLPLYTVRHYVDRFKNFALEYPDLEFFITRIGTGLAGYNDEDIAPLFIGSPENCIFDIEWKSYITGMRYFKGELK